jgi:hypothetical protein
MKISKPHSNHIFGKLMGFYRTRGVSVFQNSLNMCGMSYLRNLWRQRKVIGPIRKALATCRYCHQFEKVNYHQFFGSYE